MNKKQASSKRVEAPSNRPIGRLNARRLALKRKAGILGLGLFVVVLATYTTSMINMGQGT